MKTSKTAADLAQMQVTRYVVNSDFNQAVLFFEDDSYLQFEHTGINNRWAKASIQQSIAESVCQSLKLFRLNRKHLQLYFKDDSDAEFFTHQST